MSAPVSNVPPTVRVWDPLVRIFHVALVVACVTAWFSAEHDRDLHEWAGWIAGGLVLARLAWGFLGQGHARFDHWVPSLARLRAYLALLIRGREPRHLGHNPAAAVMMLALLGTVLGLGLSGLLMDMEAFWGDERLEALHASMAELGALAVGLHVLAALVEGWRHGENLVAAMITGRKRAPAPGDHDATRGD